MPLDVVSTGVTSFTRIYPTIGILFQIIYMNPLSPSLFMLAMELLSHAISKDVSNGLIKAFATKRVMNKSNKIYNDNRVT